MAQNYCCGQFNDAFIPKRLGNWCDHTHAHDRLCSTRVCQFRPQGHLNFIADDRGHLLPTVRKHITKKPNHWGFPVLRVWDEDFGCGCLRPRPPKKFTREPYKFSDLPAVLDAPEPRCCKEKKPEPTPRTPASTIKEPIDPTQPLPEPRRPSDIMKQFEFLRSLGVPVIWIYGFPIKSIAWTRKHFIKQLLARLDFVYIDLEAKMRGWAYYVEEALEEISNLPSSTAPPPPRRKSKDRHRKRKPNLTASETMYSYPEISIRRQGPSVAGSKPSTAASTRPTTAASSKSMTAISSKKSGKASRSSKALAKAPTSSMSSPKASTRPTTAASSKSFTTGETRPGTAGNQLMPGLFDPGFASVDANTRPGSPGADAPSKPGSRPGTGNSKGSRKQGQSRPGTRGSARSKSPGGRKRHKSKSKSSTRPTSEEDKNAQGSPDSTDTDLSSVTGRKRKRNKSKKKKAKVEKDEDDDGPTPETSQERLIRERNEKLAIKVRHKQDQIKERQKGLEEFKLIFKESIKMEAAMGGAVDDLSTLSVSPPHSKTMIGEDYYRFKALKDLAAKEAKAKTHEERQGLAWKRAAIIAQTDQKMYLPKSLNAKANVVGKNPRVDEFFQSEAGKKFEEDHANRRSGGGVAAAIRHRAASIAPTGEQGTRRTSAQSRSKSPAGPVTSKTKITFMPGAAGADKNSAPGTPRTETGASKAGTIDTQASKANVQPSSPDDDDDDDDAEMDTTVDEEEEDLPPLPTPKSHLADLPKTAQRAVKLMTKLALDSTEAFSCAGVLEMLKLAMLGVFPCKGYIIDGFPTTMEEAEEFEKNFWPMAVGIYFMNVAWTDDKRKEPAIIEPKLFRRCIDYSEKNVELACDSAGYKTIKIRHAENIDDREIDFINTVVDLILNQYSKMLRGELEKEDKRLAGLEPPYHTPLEYSSSDSSDTLSDPKTPTKTPPKSKPDPLASKSMAKLGTSDSTTPSSDSVTGSPRKSKVDFQATKSMANLKRSDSMASLSDSVTPIPHKTAEADKSVTPKSNPQSPVTSKSKEALKESTEDDSDEDESEEEEETPGESP